MNREEDTCNERLDAYIQDTCILINKLTRTFLLSTSFHAFAKKKSVQDVILLLGMGCYCTHALSI